jgi:hypothetical protein
MGMKLEHEERGELTQLSESFLTDRHTTERFCVKIIRICLSRFLM